MSNLFGKLGLTSVTSLASVLQHTSPGRDAFLQRLPLSTLKGKTDSEGESILASNFQVLSQSRARTFFYKLLVSSWYGSKDCVQAFQLGSGGGE